MFAFEARIYPRNLQYLRSFIMFPREDGVDDFMYTARRHQLAEVCPIGALGWYFFSEFHIAKNPPPDFAFYTPTPTGEIFRPWHNFVLIPDDIFHHAGELLATSN
jgi:hypothetical protein